MQKSTSVQKNKNAIRRLAIQAVFAAIAFLSMFVVNIKVQFLTLDVKDTFIAIAAMSMSPVVGIVITLLVVLLEFFVMSSTGWYGLVMNLISSLTFSVIVSLIYRLRRTRSGSYLALVSGVVGTTAVMLIANLIITPFYLKLMGWGDFSTVVQLIPTLLLPFNFIKYVINAAFILILYKPLSTVLKRAKIIPMREDPAGGKFVMTRATVLSWLCALVVLVAGVLILIFVLGGQFEWIRQMS